MGPCKLTGPRIVRLAVPLTAFLRPRANAYTPDGVCTQSLASSSPRHIKITHKTHTQDCVCPPTRAHEHFLMSLYEQWDFCCLFFVLSGNCNCVCSRLMFGLAKCFIGPAAPPLSISHEAGTANNAVEASTNHGCSWALVNRVSGIRHPSGRNYWKTGGICWGIGF